MATALGVSQRFGTCKSGEATKRAGVDWLKLFLKRHPTISTRTSETLSYGRGAGLNRIVVDQFYDLLDKYVTNGSTIFGKMFAMQQVFVDRAKSNCVPFTFGHYQLGYA